MIQFVSLHITTDQPESLAVFYRGVLDQDPAWSSDDVTGFMLGTIRLEVARHDRVAGMNRNPERLFFDLMVDDVHAEVARIVELGATIVQEPYTFTDDELQFVIATLADPDGNYFQLVAMDGE